MLLPELLAPAGSLRMAATALDFGATAIYAGQPRYSLRVRNNEFGRIENLVAGIEMAHNRSAKFYVVSNISPHNTKFKTYLADMAPVIALKLDALIMADPGLMLMIREAWPEMPIHLSVQANTVNYAAVRLWHSLGVRRVILSRELSLDEIAEIRNECPDIELEIFVHGALCVAYSGHCLLSGSKDLRAIEYVSRLIEIGVDSLKIEGRTKSAYYVARTHYALLEEREKGICSYCVTSDRHGADYLPQFDGPAHYSVIDDAKKLPQKIAEIYRKLTD